VEKDREVCVWVEGLVKQYPLFSRRRERLFALLGLQKPHQVKVALDQVSFSVAPGEALGIVGENGSGKSTLLRLIAGISRPDAGKLDVTGQVAAILELGLGFHPEFTGRENVLLYGAFLGLSREKIASRLEQILSFADLGPFVDQPLRTYSSGMAARLAFAVATQVDPQVLVVDEALAVGDGAFQRKCVDRMVELKRAGTAILFCSHSLYLVTSFCEKALWLRDGKVAAYGEAREVAEAYSEYLWSKQGALEPQPPLGPPHTPPSPRPRLLDLESEPPLALWEANVPLRLHLRLQVPPASAAYHIGVSLDTMDERCVFAFGTHWDQLPPCTVIGEPIVTLELPQLPLGNGRYWLNAFLLDETGLVVWDRLRVPAPLRISSNRWDPSLVRLPHRWVLP
jgi:lipopolysaccharide transport system ATP-binding protein